jgi:hypothetical protein
MFPERPSGSAAARPSGTIPNTPVSPFEALKARLVTRLEERMSPAASKRVPSNVMRQGLKAYAEHVVELEARYLSACDRERLVEEGLAELLGYGPLAELFRDPSVREVMVAGPTTVLARRDTAGWVPSSARFANDEHLRECLDKLATHADPVGQVTASVNLFDLKLPNGFRAVAVIPPDALGRSPTVAFVRMEVNIPSLAAEPPATASGQMLNTATTRGTTCQATPPLPAPAPRPLSGVATAPPPRAPAGVPAVASPSKPTPSGRASVSRMTPPSRPSPLEFTPSRDKLTVYRKLITERLFTHLAQHGLYDSTRIETDRLSTIVSTFISDYAERELIPLSDDDRSKLLQAILKSMGR